MSSAAQIQRSTVIMRRRFLKYSKNGTRPFHVSSAHQKKEFGAGYREARDATGVITHVEHQLGYYENGKTIKEGWCRGYVFPNTPQPITVPSQTELIESANTFLTESITVSETLARTRLNALPNLADIDTDDELAFYSWFTRTNIPALGQDYYYKNRGGRVYSSLTYLSKKRHSELTFDGETLCEVDISNWFPRILVASCPDGEPVLAALVNNGLFYEFMMQLSGVTDRQRVKHWFGIISNSTKKRLAFRTFDKFLGYCLPQTEEQFDYSKLTALFKVMCPNAYTFFRRTASIRGDTFRLCEKIETKVAVRLQNYFMNAYGVYVARKHDGFFCPAKYQAEIDRQLELAISIELSLSKILCDEKQATRQRYMDRLDRKAAASSLLVKSIISSISHSLSYLPLFDSACADPRIRAIRTRKFGIHSSMTCGDDVIWADFPDRKTQVF